jgi:uncharacterized protein (DUF58 family)
VKRASGAVALGVALCLAAGVFAAGPLYVPGMGLLLIAGGAAVWVPLAARGARVMRTLERSSVVEGAELRITVCTVRRHVPIPGGELRAWATGPALPSPGRGPSTTRATVRLARRGRHRLAPATLQIADPFGLCRRTLASGSDEVLVLPRVEPVELAELNGGPGPFGGEHTAEAAGATDVDSLQPYQSGTPASRIHWPTVARTATLMERRLVAEGERLPLLVVDPRDPASADALDRVMRAAASLCVHLARRGGCTLLLGDDQLPSRIDRELSGFATAHARLALLGPDAGAPPVGSVMGAGTVLWVSAAAAPAWGPAPVRYLISPHPQAQRPPAFIVAGCHGYRLDRTAVASTTG